MKIVFRTSVLILSIATIPYLHGFSTLKEMVEYTKAYDEIIEPDNHDYLNPDYFSAYALRSPGIFRSLRSKLTNNVAFRNTLSQGNKVLTKIIKSREIRGFNHRHILQLNHQPDDILIVWGDLQGSFHSCVRGLVELHRQGIIDDTLTVIKPNYYLIFNGNITGETDTGLELIECIASLMIKNPNNVICNTGSLEDHKVWTDHGLFKQISALAGTRGARFGFSHRVTLVNDMMHLLTRFFNTLPIATFIGYPENNNSKKYALIRISGYGADAPELDTRNFDDFFNEGGNLYSTKDRLSIYRLKNVIPAKNPAYVRAFITSLPGFIRFEKTEGLMQLEAIDGSIVWSIFSAPSPFQRKINQFFFDAFAKITLHEKLEEATIELIHRDARTNEAFHVEGKYLLTSGVRISNHVAQDQTNNPIIALGASFDLSRGASNIGIALRKGIVAALEDGQEKLAPEQPKLRISFFDDKLSAYQAALNLQDIKNSYKLPIITFPITADVMYSYLDSLRDGSLLALFPISGSTELHSTKFPGIIFYRPSYNHEIKTLIQEEFSKTTDGNFCFFYQDDNFGKNALEVARKEMKKHNRKWVEIPHLPNQTNFTQQIQEFKKHNFTAIFFLSLSLTTREFLQQLGTQDLVRLNLYGISMVGGKGFHHFMRETGLIMNIAQVVPNPETSTLQIVQEYRVSMDKRNNPYSTASLEGYIYASLLIDAVSHIKGPVTKEAFEAYFTGLKNYDFKGLSLSFHPEHRNLSQKIWLDQGNPIWKEYQEDIGL